jgi:hypothetical protein
MRPFIHVNVRTLRSDVLLRESFDELILKVSRDEDVVR